MPQAAYSWPRTLWLAVLVSCASLGGCAQQGNPTATIVLPQGQLACFRHLDTGTPTAMPQMTRAQAEAAVRASYASSQKNVQLGAPVHEAYVSVVASGIRHPQTGADELAGRDVWVVGFSDGSERRYALVDPQTGHIMSGCGAPEAAFHTPTP